MVPWDTGCRPWRQCGPVPVCAHWAPSHGSGPRQAGQDAACTEGAGLSRHDSGKPDHASERGHCHHRDGASADDAVLLLTSHLIDHCSPPVWLGVMGVMKGARPRRSGPPPRARDVGDAAPGMLAHGRQVRETQGRDDLPADVQVEVLHVVDHHLG